MIIRRVVGERVYLIQLNNKGLVYCVKVREKRDWIHGMNRSEQHTIWHVGSHGPRGRKVRETSRIAVALREMGYTDPSAFLAGRHVIVRRQGT